VKLSLRSTEWLLVIYFGYVAAIAPRFPLQQQVVWRPFLVEALVCLLFLALAYGESREHAELFGMLRDWVPVALLLLAYREMDWFSALPRNFDWELRWVEWDRTILYRGALQRAVESLGALGPLFLELCYVLVYAVAPFVVAVFYFQRRRDVSVFSFRSAARGVWGDRHAERRYAAAAPEFVAGGRLRHSLQRVSERARIVGVLGRLGVLRVSAGAQGIRLGNVVVCGERSGSHGIRALPLCGGCWGGNRDQPDPRRYDSSVSPPSCSRPS
jgi:hypothetical protein